MVKNKFVKFRRLFVSTTDKIMWWISKKKFLLRIVSYITIKFETYLVKN